MIEQLKERTIIVFASCVLGTSKNPLCERLAKTFSGLLLNLWHFYFLCPSRIHGRLRPCSPSFRLFHSGFPSRHNAIRWNFFKDVNILHGPSFSFLKFVCTCVFCLIYCFLLLFSVFSLYNRTVLRVLNGPCLFYNRLHFHLKIYIYIFSIRTLNIFEV